jgi:hypothetical protein
MTKLEISSHGKRTMNKRERHEIEKEEREKQ